jgi:hypothetical protein
MRILNAVSRRGLDFNSVHAEYDGQHHSVAMPLEVTPKQSGQLFREWYAIVDVIDVQASAPQEHEAAAWAAHPPASEGAAGRAARAALA